jgi:hypothetical protein
VSVDSSRFLALLREGDDADSTVRFHFRTFDDDKARSRPNLTRNLSGAIETLSSELAAMNGAGAGIFFVVNEGGHRDDEITRICAVFVDTDGAELDPIMRCELEPHLVVETSPGRWHVYWLVDGLNADEFRALQAALAARFDTDPSVTNPSRVMRLPGFNHRKGRPHPVKLIHESGAQRYTREKILATFLPDGMRPSTVTAPRASIGVEHVHEDSKAELRDALTRIDADSRGTFIKVAAALATADCGEELFSEYCARSAKHRPAADLATFRGMVGKSKSHWRAVFDLARAAGWKDPPAAPTLPPAHGARTALSTAIEHAESQACGLRAVPLEIIGAALAPPEFVVDQLVPRRLVTLLSGNGGIGKSTLALVMLVCAAIGRDFLGFASKRGRVVYISLEDEVSLVRWRLHCICSLLGVDPLALRDHLTIVDGTEGEAALVVERNENGVRSLVPTANLDGLRKLTEGAELVVIDNASDAYDADENQRRMVRGFLRLLTGIARANNGAVVLLSHIDKHAAKHGGNGQTFSGSSAWNNSVRSRLAFVEHDGALELRHEKSNLGKKAAPIRMTIGEHGVPMPAHGVAQEGALLVADADDDIVLDAIRSAHSMGATIPTAMSGPSTALHALCALPEFPSHLRARAGRDRVAHALTRLQRAGKIERQSYINASRHARERFIPANAPVDVRCSYPHTPTPEPARLAPPVPPVRQFPTTGATGAPAQRRKPRSGRDAA